MTPTDPPTATPPATATPPTGTPMPTPTGDGDSGIPFLGALPELPAARPQRRGGLSGAIGARFNRMRALLQQAGKGLVREQDARAVNTVVFIVVSTGVMAVLTGLFLRGCL